MFIVKMSMVGGCHLCTSASVHCHEIQSTLYNSNWQKFITCNKCYSNRLPEYKNTFTNALMHFYHHLQRADAYLHKLWMDVTQPKFRISLSPVDSMHFPEHWYNNRQKCINAFMHFCHSTDVLIISGCRPTVHTSQISNNCVLKPLSGVE